LGATGNSSLEQWVGTKQVIKPGENIEISLAEGRWLIVKVPPLALIESREVVWAAMSVSTGSDVTVSRRFDGVTRADVTASHHPHPFCARCRHQSLVQRGDHPSRMVANS
jgi:hypothetical protein